MKNTFNVVFGEVMKYVFTNPRADRPDMCSMPIIKNDNSYNRSKNYWEIVMLNKVESFPVETVNEKKKTKIIIINNNN